MPLQRFRDAMETAVHDVVKRCQPSNISLHSRSKGKSKLHYPTVRHMFMSLVCGRKWNCDFDVPHDRQLS